ncbi:hypothetical protein ALC60_12986 [Trachymyrmex zeteki]|uniref:Uncharacterized protein n=1 Tax=Mycetomoellerius zeteki TaxID=64791 RepID=A0A151WJK5_9HYME|nr:hypothetical protein ALC60_12986 [Trachymyrmex zeteki]
MPRASEGLEEHAMEIRETIAETWIPSLLGGGKTVRNAAPRDSVGGSTPSRFSFAEVFTMLLQNCWNILCCIECLCVSCCIYELITVEIKSVRKIGNFYYIFLARSLSSSSGQQQP